MFLSYLYLKTGQRHPVLLRQPAGITDVQAQIPWGWCSRCGAEVYLPGEAKCEWCQMREEQENVKSEVSL